MIIDIKNLNKMSKSNDYFMSLQSNIINFVNECLYVNVKNAIDFFHQWLIRITNRHKLIVVSHRDNEQFNVTIINFRNNSTYVQRQIDIIFRNFRDFFRVYVNDIVMFNKTFEKHIKHLFKIFELFHKLNITLKFNKIYFEYFIVVLFDKKIDNFEFIIVEKKLKIIFKFQIFVILKLLKTYLKFIDWMRDYVFYYV